MEVVVNSLRVAVPGLPRPVWILNLGFAVNSVGNGLIVPFLLIYLHNVRGFSLGAAGLVPTVHFAVALACGIAAGALFDRLGGRVTAAVALVLLAVGFGLFPLVREVWQALLLAAIAGAGRGAFWPSYSGLLAAVTPPELRPSAYAVQRVGGNLGLAIGSLAAGLLVTVSDPRTFTWIFLINAMTSLVFAAALPLVPAVRPVAGERTSGRYRAVLSDRTFIALIAVNFAFVTAGVALLNSVLPLFAKNDVGVGERVIGLVFVVNTITIVVAQFPVTRLLEGRRRMQALAVMGGIWAFSWVLALAAGGTTRMWLAAGFLLVAAAIFALGECIHGVVQGPLVADLAPEELRGRYMAAWLTTAQLGFALGPAIGAFALAASPALLWLGAACVCALCAVGSLAIEEGLPAVLRRSPTAETAAT
jgi:MFS family permease